MEGRLGCKHGNNPCCEDWFMVPGGVVGRGASGVSGGRVEGGGRAFGWSPQEGDGGNKLRR